MKPFYILFTALYTFILSFYSSKWQTSLRLARLNMSKSHICGSTSDIITQIVFEYSDMFSLSFQCIYHYFPSLRCVRTVVSARRQAERLIILYLLWKRGNQRLSWSCFQTLSAWEHQIILNPTYFPSAFSLKDSNYFTNYLLILTICDRGTRCQMSGPFYRWRLCAA